MPDRIYINIKTLPQQKAYKQTSFLKWNSYPRSQNSVLKQMFWYHVWNIVAFWVSYLMMAVPQIQRSGDGCLLAGSNMACKTNTRSTDSITVWTEVGTSGNDLIQSPFLLLDASFLCSTASFMLKGFDTHHRSREENSISSLISIFCPLKSKYWI